MIAPAERTTRDDRESVRLIPMPKLATESGITRVLAPNPTEPGVGAGTVLVHEPIR